MPAACLHIIFCLKRPTAFLLILLISGNRLSAQAFSGGPALLLAEAPGVQPHTDTSTERSGTAAAGPGMMQTVKFTSIKAQRAGRQIQLFWEATSAQEVQH